jgi:hypothetical protein
MRTFFTPGFHRAPDCLTGEAAAPAASCARAAEARRRAGLAPRWRSAASAVTLAAALAGCAVGPDYHAPAAVLPAAFVQGPALAAHNAAAPPAAPLDRWWDGFRDPELNRIVARVLAQNLDLAAARARIRQARAAADYAGAQQLPQGRAYASIAQ